MQHLQKRGGRTHSSFPAASLPHRTGARPPRICVGRASNKESTVAYFALLYDLVDDMVNRRIPYREAHLGLAREAHARGELLLAGALTDPTDRALLVFKADAPTAVEEFVRKDPYVVNGLVKRWEIRPWTVVVGNQ